MMLADPRRMQANLFGEYSLVENIGDEGVGVPLVALVVVIAQCEIAELYSPLPVPTQDAPVISAGASG